MSIPRTAIGNLIVYIARRSKDSMVVDEVNTFTIELEELIEKHKRTVRPRVVEYVLKSFAMSLKGVLKWPSGPSET